MLLSRPGRGLSSLVSSQHVPGGVVHDPPEDLPIALARMRTWLVVNRCRVFSVLLMAAWALGCGSSSSAPTPPTGEHEGGSTPDGAGGMEGGPTEGGDVQDGPSGDSKTCVAGGQPCNQDSDCCSDHCNLTTNDCSGSP
jgi:hypothetical protein